VNAGVPDFSDGDSNGRLICGEETDPDGETEVLESSTGGCICDGVPKTLGESHFIWFEGFGMTG
jgi:hypothetical protein